MNEHESIPETETIIRKKQPKWHRIYYLLALFDVVVVLFGLYLNHRIISIQNDSVQENQAWSKRLENYLELAEMAAMVNAPGNDVFDTGDHVGERKKLEEALAVFDEKMKEHYDGLEREIPPQYVESLRKDFETVNNSMSEMTTEAGLIFGFFSENRADLAGRRMAEMDRKYFRLNRALTTLRQDVMSIQQTLLANQAEEAGMYRRFELLSAGFILLMVSAALFYGHKIKKKMEVSGQERELFIDELQNTHDLLKKAQDGLETKVAQRTKELSNSNSLVENIIGSMADILIVVDDKGLIQKVNHAASLLLGYESHEIIGKPVNFLVQSESLLKDEEFEQMLNTGYLIELEKDFIKKKGGFLRVSLSAAILQGHESAAVMVAKDLSKRLEDERRLRDYSLKLEQSNRELQDFAFVASHDLQEPLRKVQAFGSRLEVKFADSMPDEARDYIRRMREASARMQNLVKDLLSFSRISSNGQAFTQVDLAKIANEVVSDLEIRIEETKAKIEIASIPEIEADASQMRQLLQNLMGNALKFKRTGIAPEVKIYVCDNEKTIHRTFEDRDQINLVIEDNGIGFDEKYLDRIFTVFQRLHRQNEFEGSGIGLAVCRKIIERHAGTITAESKPDQGSKFIVTLPRKRNRTVHTYD